VVWRCCFDWDTGEHFTALVALEKLQPFVFLLGVCLVLLGLWGGKADEKAFVGAFAIALVYSLLALFAVGATSVRGSGAIKETKSYRWPADLLPVQQVTALTACLIRHEYLHTENGFRNSLKEIGPNWNCIADIPDPMSYQRYWISYSPIKDGKAGKNMDFRIRALLAGNAGIGRSGPVVSDGRGELLTFSGGFADAAPRPPNTAPKYVHETFDPNGESLGTSIQLAVRSYGNKNIGSAPQSLDEIRGYRCAR
jgi:hypothetical protein